MKYLHAKIILEIYCFPFHLILLIFHLSTMDFECITAFCDGILFLSLPPRHLPVFLDNIFTHKFLIKIFTHKFQINIFTHKFQINIFTHEFQINIFTHEFQIIIFFTTNYLLFLFCFATLFCYSSSIIIFIE